MQPRTHPLVLGVLSAQGPTAVQHGSLTGTRSRCLHADLQVQAASAQSQCGSSTPLQTCTWMCKPWWPELGPSQVRRSWSAGLQVHRRSKSCKHVPDFFCMLANKVTCAQPLPCAHAASVPVVSARSLAQLAQAESAVIVARVMSTQAHDDTSTRTKHTSRELPPVCAAAQALAGRV